mmetsp:Transcript_9606/g.15739  ORF Transcript_9606/g.15739 Transcript_9606/m.15739 type:complete len:584 (-) Transcript_9606:97-1848(-)|eukprot:CAMPEP_0203762988 /NCGR_PEP_ID=MMETSP0098-20131031/15731_1 /ASSEMBLY_ACC=CAM_ASM_000208 /TAXON_ID=96639 /ORGANISM=" , Strain NY0313808BC1" /LENGTH=583 /DNA_ID=CAMNT_0050657591 /DNA_START=417 /DNA_END=2168 /DNA_ORIENTATION=-
MEEGDAHGCFARREALSSAPSDRDQLKIVTRSPDIAMLLERQSRDTSGNDRSVSLSSMVEPTPSYSRDLLEEDSDGKRRNSWSYMVDSFRHVFVSPFVGQAFVDKSVEQEDFDGNTDGGSNYEDSVDELLDLIDCEDTVEDDVPFFDTAAQEPSDENSLIEYQEQSKENEMVSAECVDFVLEKEKATADTEMMSDGDDESCFICLSPFTEDDDSKRIDLPCSAKCNNAPVHEKCIYEWKERRNTAKEHSGTCPLCRQPLSVIKFSPPDLLRINTFVMFAARKRFVQHPIPPSAGIVRCYLRVSPSSWLGSSTYQMYIQGPCALPYPLGVLPGPEGPQDGDQLLLTARKRFGFGLNMRTDMSLDRNGEDYSQRSPNYVGTVTSNFTGLEHTITSPYGDNSSGPVGTQELGCVVYAQNRFGLGVGPRKMRVALPQVTQVEGARSSGIQNMDDDLDIPTPTRVTTPYRPSVREETMAHVMQGPRQQIIDNENIKYGENREPSWLEAIQAYSLDFHGRVTLPSNKNFQLCLLDDPDEKDKTVFQFGKVVSHETHQTAVYTMDFQYPMSPVQCFAIAISACSQKLGCA